MTQELEKLTGLEGVSSVEAKEDIMLMGKQLLFKFDNGRELSVIRNKHSYGGEQGLFEAWDFVSPDPQGWLSLEEVERLVRAYAQMTPVGTEEIDEGTAT